MAAASQGAREAGGHVIGVTSATIERWRGGARANPHVLEEIHCGTLRERICRLVESCDGALVLPGGVGTLAELSLLWYFVMTGEVGPRPIVTVGDRWRAALAGFRDERFTEPAHEALVVAAGSVEEAVEALLAEL